jgi:hypothetical protein
MKIVNGVLIGLMSICIIACIILLVLICTAPPIQPKVTEYKPQTSTTQKQDDEDDCSIAMCNAFGGGIVGDTLAIQFMNGD